jgi:hypothetical protein
MGRIINETAVTSLVSADVLLVDNPTLGTRKIAHSDLSAQYEQVSRKGVASGYAELDSTGKVPAAQLRSAFTIEEVADAAARNALTVLTAEIGVRQVRLADTGVIYVPNAAGSGAGIWVQYNSQGYASTAAQGNVELATDTEARDVQNASALLVPPVSAMQAAMAALRNALSAAQGLWFDGATGSNTAGTLRAAPGANPWSVSLSFLVPTAAADMVLFFLGSARTWGTENAVAILVRSDGALSFEYFGTSGNIARKIYAGFVTEYAGKWVHMTWTRSSTTIALYLQGKAATVAADNAGTPPALSGAFDGTLYTRGGVTSGGYFTGLIGPGYFYNYALSAAQAAARYEAQAAARVDYPDAPAGVATNTSAFVDNVWSAGMDTLTGASSTGFATTRAASGGDDSVISQPAFTVKKGDIIRCIFTLVNAGDLPQLYLGDSVTGAAKSALSATTATTQTIDLVATADGTVCIAFYTSNTQAADYTVSGFTAAPLGAMLALHGNAPGNGLVWNDKSSGGGAHEVLPASGVTWAQPSNAVNQIRGITNSNGNQALLGASALILGNSQLVRARARSRSGTPTITIGTASGGSQIVSSVALSTTWKDLTIALTGGIVSSTDDIWIGSNSTDVVETCITHEPLGF